MMRSWARKSSAALVLLAACGTSSGTSPAGVTLAEAIGAPDFHFDSLDSREVSSDSLRGKPAVLVFVDTSNLIAQLVVNDVVGLAPSLPDVNFAIVALENPSQRELVEMYRDTLKVKFPVAIADTATSAGGGTLGDVHVVPTTVVLGRNGRVAWRFTGRPRPSDLRAHLRGL